MFQFYTHVNVSHSLVHYFTRIKNNNTSQIHTPRHKKKTENSQVCLVAGRNIATRPIKQCFFFANKIVNVGLQHFVTVKSIINALNYYTFRFTFNWLVFQYNLIIFWCNSQINIILPLMAVVNEVKDKTRITKRIRRIPLSSCIYKGDGISAILSVLVFKVLGRSEV